jgi:hypothetical protein
LTVDENVTMNDVALRAAEAIDERKNFNALAEARLKEVVGWLVELAREYNVAGQGTHQGVATVDEQQREITLTALPRGFPFTRTGTPSVKIDVDASMKSFIVWRIRSPKSDRIAEHTERELLWLREVTLERIRAIVQEFFWDTVRLELPELDPRPRHA